jgi:hypothetical protein
MKMAVFWVVAPCSLVEVYQRFRSLCCHHHHRPDDGGGRKDRYISTRLYGAATQKTAIFIIVTQLVNKCSVSKVHYSVHKSPPPVPILTQVKSSSHPPTYFVLILSSHQHLGTESRGRIVTTSASHSRRPGLNLGPDTGANDRSFAWFSSFPSGK